MPGALEMRYARALADVVTAPGSKIDAHAAAAEVASFAGLLVESPELKIALESPAVPRPRQRAIIARLAKDLGLSDVTRRFLMVLLDHGRVRLLGEIGDAFELVMDERLGIARAEVLSARPLPAPQQQEIVAGLARLTGKQTRAQFRIQEDLIGGVMARIGSTVYDGSVRGQLDALRQRLAGTGS
ncbi:MAG: ATP synthase F1 subunit delta [Acidobacteriota bacterium]